jgi:hypothetical protein
MSLGPIIGHCIRENGAVAIERGCCNWPWRRIECWEGYISRWHEEGRNGKRHILDVCERLCPRSEWCHQILKYMRVSGDLTARACGIYTASRECAVDGVE